MKILFEHSDGSQTEIGTATKRQEAWKIIMDFLKNHEYKSYYQRVTKLEDQKGFWIDVGSWSEAFICIDMTDEEYKEFYDDVT